MYKEFKIRKSEIFENVFIIEPTIFIDERGNIFTTYLREIYSSFIPAALEFHHDKFAKSKHNVLRGLHGDTKTWKLVSCVWGEIYEVVADVRKESPTYGKWESFILDSENYKQVLIPPGFVNGYYVLSDYALFHYKLAYEGKYIDAGDQITIRWDDPELNIKWPCTDPVLQERDEKGSLNI